METPRKFKGSLFGYAKKDVNTYILENAKKFEDAKTVISAERDKLRAANSELQTINNELKTANDDFASQKCSLEDKIATLEKERTYIADALLNAQQEAEKMLCEARVGAAQTRSALELELEELRAQIRSEKTRIDEMRNDAKSALSMYIDNLDNINMESEPSSNTEENVGEFDTVASDEDENETMDEGEDAVCENDIISNENSVGYNFEPEAEPNSEETVDEDEDNNIYIPDGDDDFEFGIEDIES